MVCANEATAVATRSPSMARSGFSVVMPLPTWWAISISGSMSSRVIARMTSMDSLSLDTDADDVLAGLDAERLARFKRQADRVAAFGRHAGQHDGAELALAAGHGVVDQRRLAAARRRLQLRVRDLA